MTNELRVSNMRLAYHMTFADIQLMCSLTVADDLSRGFRWTAAGYRRVQSRNSCLRGKADNVQALSPLTLVIVTDTLTHRFLQGSLTAQSSRKRRR